MLRRCAAHASRAPRFSAAQSDSSRCRKLHFQFEDPLRSGAPVRLSASTLCCDGRASHDRFLPQTECMPREEEVARTTVLIIIFFLVNTACARSLNRWSVQRSAIAPMITRMTSGCPTEDWTIPLASRRSPPERSSDLYSGKTRLSRLRILDRGAGARAWTPPPEQVKGLSGSPVADTPRRCGPRPRHPG
jgi:hypothetical protein